MAAVTLRNLNKRFGEVQAVVNLNLQIKEGEFVTLLGPSGCGKTTTLNCIAGLEEASSGEILFDEQVVNDLPPGERGVAMVFQDYALYPHMTVYDNLAFGLKMRNVPKKEIEQRTRQVAETLDIGNLLHRRPAQLSGGQRQRVALGRTIVRDAAVFLMDEPLSNLDAALRVRTRSEIKALQRQLGTTTVYVTHDQEEAMVLSDRVAIMHHGVLQQYSSSHEIYNNPVNFFVASFVGNPKMNFIEGQCNLGQDALSFQTEGIQTPLPAKLLTDRLRKAGNRPLLLGVRPEDVKVNRERRNTDLAGQVFLVEPVGPVDYLDLKLGKVELRASVDPNLRFQGGETVGVSLNQDKLYLFDKQTGERLA
ncbi:MAG: ABC transporter ATP-binding protein [Caldilineaceae bacterium]